MNTNIHSINLPKIVQIGWGHHVDFCVWKNRPLLLAKGVYSIPNIFLLNNLYTVFHIYLLIHMRTRMQMHLEIPNKYIHTYIYIYIHIILFHEFLNLGFMECRESNVTAACANHFRHRPSSNHYSVLHGAVCLLKLVPSCLLSMTKCYRTRYCGGMSSYKYGNPVYLISGGNFSWHRKLSE